ncbi:type II toxin-antitoxin system RelE/ParE family toxin [Lichenifustis flavocetrariae]|uniref:Toxin n=1 Tax=Lichenifustis flavocetrariae TaxID=2949735 RepID=A0AA42CMB7_9HYPH|nr:type II toxin-antitoxin system RelE/ParE family toxin [Lichenifustis flavocetrariae]MCW6512514.1 type II toxin-antitoxin system RelE/ParE family toxin [Lichenifustis flavocetrariae]
MAEYILSRRAERDLLDIYASTEISFGQYQADAYHAGLERSFSLLADFPRMGTSADELATGFRRFRFQSHYIFYTEERAHILIRALLHVKMNLRPDLFE